jgi:DNA-binding NarL/FixJ family response regulator
VNEPAAPIRILLADDHAVVRAGIRQFLEQAQDLQVIAEASNGQEASQYIDSLHPDVAVLDVQMPKMSGIEVVHWVRSHQIPTGLLILTAYDDDPYVQAVLRAGANGYVLKTSGPDEIIQAVHDVFDGKMVLDAALTQRFLTRIAGQTDAGLIEPLTERELEILTRVGKGLTNKAIGVQLNISDRTVQNHLAHIFGKLQAASRTEAVMRGVSLGLLPPNLVQSDQA